YSLGVGRSRDRKYLFAKSRSSETSETRYVPADDPARPWTVVLPRENEHQYSVDHRDDQFYIVTNKDAKNYRYVSAPVSDPTPRSVYDYDLNQRRLKLLKRQEVPGGHNPEQYETERLYVTARDGAKVPISLVHKKGIQRDGRAPLLLVGYGSYGASSPVTFSTAQLSVLDRGVTCALAHIRGG